MGISNIVGFEPGSNDGSIATLLAAPLAELSVFLGLGIN